MTYIRVLTISLYTRAVCKVCGLTLLLRVGTLWRCDDGLFFQVPPLTSDALLTTLHPLLENVLQTVNHFEISYFGAPFSWLEKPRNRMGRDVDCTANVLMGFQRTTFRSVSAIQTRSRLMRFLDFSNHENGAPRLLLKLAANGLQHVIEKWVERCEKCIACQGKYFEKGRHRTSTKFGPGVIR
jgi:hypothetical protein